MSVPTPPQTDTYSTALDIYDHTQPLTVDAANRLYVNAIISGGSSTIGTVDQGLGGSSPWLVTGPLTDIQLRASPVPISGSVNAIQSGAWSVGRTWTLASGTDSVTAFQGTSPWIVSGSVTTSPNVNVHDGSGISISSTGSSLNVDVTNTVPVSGTITANIGTTGGLALDTTLTNSTQKSQIVQGGNTAVVDATGDLQVDVNNFPASQNVVVTNTPTVNQGTNPWIVNGSGFTQPVSGTVAVSNFPAVQNVAQSFGSEVTYSFAGGVTMAALATDVFTINGSNTKVIRILEIELFLERTTAGTVPITFIRRSANNTGGTSATFGAVAQDPNDPVSSGNVTLYTANPAALGASPGNVGVTFLAGTALGTATQSGYKIEFLYDGFGKGVMLRNANQHIACNFGGTTVAGGILFMNITWVEE